MILSEHERWMRRALQLARKGRFGTSPNPMVGACVVRKGKLAGSGYHARYGSDHAEIAALRQAGSKARGASLYVTLEPCSSWGKTPPCVSAVLKSGVREVIIASEDPNPANRGKAIAALRKAGVRVISGVLEKEARELNAPFFKWIKTGFPYVTLKMAQSLDGKIASTSGRSRWISSPGARNFVHLLRAEHDAVLVGKNTLLADDPFLNPRVRVPGLNPEKPWRIAMDPDFRVKANARIFKGPQVTLRVISEKNLRRKAGEKKQTSALLPVPEIKGKLDLKTLCRRLGALGVSKLLVEGGGETAWSFLRAGLVDRAFWIVAPKIIGGRAARTSVEGEGFEDPNRSLFLSKPKVSKLGDDWLFEFVPKY